MCHKEIAECRVKKCAVLINLVIHGSVEVAIAIRSIAGNDL